MSSGLVAVSGLSVVFSCGFRNVGLSAPCEGAVVLFVCDEREQEACVSWRGDAFFVAEGAEGLAEGAGCGVFVFGVHGRVVQKGMSSFVGTG